MILTLREAVPCRRGCEIRGLERRSASWRFEAMKVGELAKRTGLTVRTLHHYDEIELLKPSLHTESGHRLYTADDVARLQQVLSLRQLGFSVEEVRDCLDRPGFSALEMIGLRVARLRERIETQLSCASGWRPSPRSFKR